MVFCCCFCFFGSSSSSVRKHMSVHDFRCKMLIRNFFVHVYCFDVFQSVWDLTVENCVAYQFHHFDRQSFVQDNGLFSQIYCNPFCYLCLSVSYAPTHVHLHPHMHVLLFANTHIHHPPPPPPPPSPFLACSTTIFSLFCFREGPPSSLSAVQMIFTSAETWRPRKLVCYTK